MGSRAVCGTKGPRGERDKLRSRRSRGANGGRSSKARGDGWYRSTQREDEEAGVGDISWRGSRGEGEREERGADAGEAVGGV
jgi:hypothetical protein